MRQPIESLLNSAATIIDAELASRDRALGERLREKKQIMAGDGRLGYGPDWVVMLEMYEGELAPRAGIVRDASLSALKAAKETPTADEASEILVLASARIRAAYDALIASATPFFAEHPGWFIPRLTERAVQALSESLERLRLEIANLRTMAEKKMPAKNVQITVAVLTFIFALILAGLTNVFSTRAREQEQLVARRGEIITELLPKLEGFRRPLDAVTSSSEAKDEAVYERELGNAIRETDIAISGLSDGYDLIRTKVVLNFDSTLVLSLDSIGKEAGSGKADLQQTLAELRGRHFLQPPRNPGENLAAFQALNAHVTRFEKSLLSQH